ncbi:MAG: tRNA (adenosine(37)-N6)-threonylcarbamoyltransferase complex transferase subunit TsaD [Bacteroidetes bacterium]|nr:tRNA (adenosine(37)-N6)-threonylcarbamoyltransferase complex transferase subunit TsaD [Bacteroidota bacterium]
MNSPTILAIESSCDDTGAAILSQGNILSNVVMGQQAHRLLGGVVPELASRDHQRKVTLAVEEALIRAKIHMGQLDAIAVTNGPGLLGSLLVGLAFAKGLALALDKPLIAVDHLDAHVLAHFIGPRSPQFPFLCLLVSGGHTQLVLVRKPLCHEVLGATIDDAAGEAFDKGAKCMGLPYPGGPEIDRLAKQGNPLAFSFKFPKVQGYHYSFSGLKTALLYFLQAQQREDKDFIKNNLNDLCASWQKTIGDYLMTKLEMAVRDHGIQHLGIAGGVAANSYLRQKVVELGRQQGIETYVPAMEYCVDNAAMIAQVAGYKYGQAQFAPLTIEPYTRNLPKSGVMDL